jgi:photosystem II stability/assembly factor-like uncharacterized protein
VQDVPKFVLKRLQKTADVESHPDADLLTAFAEQSLLAPERARVMEHLARCADCREVIALAPPATQDTEDVAAVTTSTSLTRSGWLRWPVLRWSVVIVGLVAITSVGILQYRQHHQKNQTLNAALTAPNETATPEPAIQPAPASSSELQEIPRQTKNAARADARKKAQPNRQDARAKRNSSRWLSQLYPTPRGGSAVGSGAGAGVASGSVGGQASAAAAPAPNPSVPQQPAIPSSSETVQVDSEAAAAVPTTESQLSDQRGQNQKGQPSKDKSSTNLDGGKTSVRWSISSDGALQRSFDAGHTWAAVNLDTEPAISHSKAAAFAGNTNEVAKSKNEVAKSKQKVKAQPSSNTTFRALVTFGTEIWAGGSAAILYHSTDSGSHWARVLPSSSGATLTGDITSIEFSDPQRGRIATSSGEIWITPDDGQTWRQQ